MSSDEPEAPFPLVSNLWLTNYCGRSCVYCMARDHLEWDREQGDFMSHDQLHSVIEWIHKSRQLSDVVHVMGGEPTSHPQVVEVFEHLCEARLVPSVIFTNGLCETETLAAIKQVLETNGMREYSFTVNVDAPSTYSNEQWERLRSNLQLLSPPEDSSRDWGREELHRSRQLVLAITLYEPDQSYEYVLELAGEYDVPHIRASVSQPAASFSNAFVDFSELKKLRPTIVQFVRDCVDRGIQTGFECVVPPCVFDLKEWRFLQNFTAKLSGTCSTPLDILPNLKVVHCCVMDGKLGGFQAGDPETSQKFRSMMQKKGKIQSQPREWCEGCDFFAARECQGGCLKFKLDSPEEQSG